MIKPLKISVGMSSCNMAAGSRALYDILERADLGVDIEIMGCLGMCHAEPQVQITDADGKVFLYHSLNPAKMEKIVADHLRDGNPVSPWLFDATKGDGAALMEKQQRIVLGNCGCINPESIDDYLARDGYQALKKVLEQNDPQAGL